MARMSQFLLRPDRYDLKRYGEVLSDEISGQLLEVTVIYDIRPLLISRSSWVFKAWFTIQFAPGEYGIGYAESKDGMNWIKRPGVILPNYLRSTVTKDKGTYKMWAVPRHPLDEQIDYLTSTDGINFTLHTPAVVTKSGGDNWDAAYVSNSRVRKEKTGWKMLYEARTAFGPWKIGLATSSDGITWTKHPSNPVLDFPGSIGGPSFYKDGSRYFLLAHCSPTPGSFLPTDLYAFASWNLINWETLNGGQPILPRLLLDENPNNNDLINGGQVADPRLVTARGQTLIFYTAAPNQSFYHVNLAEVKPRRVA